MYVQKYGPQLDNIYEAIDLLGRADRSAFQEETWAHIFLIHVALWVIGVNPHTPCQCQDKADYCDICAETIEILDRWDRLEKKPVTSDTRTLEEAKLGKRQAG
jgi:hypothetical protein